MSLPLSPMPPVSSSSAQTPPQSPGLPVCSNLGTRSAALATSLPSFKNGDAHYSRLEFPPLSFASSAVGMRA
eukprot:4414246-Prorocentrum_lima.AAC.1